MHLKENSHADGKAFPRQNVLETIFNSLELVTFLLRVLHTMPDFSASQLSHSGLGDLPWPPPPPPAVALLASAVVGARNMNAFENQASRFQLTVGVGHGETNKQTKNASEQLVLIKGTLPQRPR